MKHDARPNPIGAGNLTALYLWLLLVGVLPAVGDEAAISAEEVVNVVSEATQAQSRGGPIRTCACSLHSCSNKHLSEGHKCSTKLGNTSQCPCSDGMKLDFSRSSVRTPPGVDPDDLPQHVADSLCRHQDLDAVFREIGKRKGPQTWTYYGTMSGVMRMWPSKARPRGLSSGSFDPLLGNCRTYDPRLRPWFFAAVTSGGPKDLVVILDKTESMEHPSGSSTRLSIAKKITEAILAYTTIADHIAIVPVGFEVRGLVSDSLMEGTKSTRQQLLASMEKLIAGGRKRDENGFSEAFKILADSEDLEKSSKCQKIIIHISDGHNCKTPKNGTCLSGFDSVERVHAKIEDGQRLLAKKGSGRASIFTISVGQDSLNGLARQIACNNGGVWTQITDSDDILHKLHGYISFLASLRQAKNDLVWSSFYEDDGGLGTMTTATRPIYKFNESESIRGRLMGVVGHDVLVSQLGDSGASYLSVLGRVTGRLGICNVQNMSTCALQVLREEQCPEIRLQSCHLLASSKLTYYFSGSKRVIFGEAVKECESLGGTLVEPISEEQLAFVSGLAAADGTWVGLESNSGEWKWRQSDKVLGQDIFWAPGFHDPNGLCASIDPRGIQRNGQSRLCSEKLSYICQFTSQVDAEKVCNAEEVIKIEDGSNKMIPTAAECLRKEGLADDGGNDGELGSDMIESMRKNAICDLGAPKQLEELLCCGNCSTSMQQDIESWGWAVSGSSQSTWALVGVIWIILFA